MSSNVSLLKRILPVDRDFPPELPIAFLFRKYGERIPSGTIPLFIWLKRPSIPLISLFSLCLLF
ncbi:hypothetical protein BOX30_10850 [Leptospirillum ferriphilum]|nr:hypothetical protein BOX30_10850 [Leptospirillum ferriphilum]